MFAQTFDYFNQTIHYTCSISKLLWKKNPNMIIFHSFIHIFIQNMSYIFKYMLPYGKSHVPLLQHLGGILLP